MASRGNPARFFVNAIPSMRRFDPVAVVTKGRFPAYNQYRFAVLPDAFSLRKPLVTY